MKYSLFSIAISILIVSSCTTTNKKYTALSTHFNNPSGLLKISSIKSKKPHVNKKNVRVWNAKLTNVIRINLIEFNGALPLHRHPDASHNMLVVDGAVKVLLGEKTFKAHEGDFIFIPSNVPHKYWTIGKSATLIAMDAPYYDRKKTVYLE